MPATPAAFISPTFHVYIEDTDAYGVMYNGNYLRSYERALSHVPRERDEEVGVASNDGDYNAQSAQPAEEKEEVGQWIVSFVANQKFRSSPMLGEEYSIRGERLDLGSPQENTAVWQLELATPKMPGGGLDDAEKNCIVHNSARVTITRAPAKCAPISSSSAPLPSSRPRSDRESAEITGAKMFEQRYTVYRDEFDVHDHSQRPPGEHQRRTHGYHIPLRNALNFFERSRSAYLGGPAMLRKMQVEDDIVWVVTSIDEGELLLDPMVLESSCPEHDDDDEAESGGLFVLVEDTALDVFHPTPGQEVMVRTQFIAKRRGMIVICQHQLYMDVEAEVGLKRRRLLARATVTIMALKGSTRRPTSKLPQWLLDILCREF